MDDVGVVFDAMDGQRVKNAASMLIPGADRELQFLLVTISDVTHLLEAQRAEQRQRDVLRLVDRLLRDRDDVQSFLREASDLLERMQDAEESEVDRARRGRSRHRVAR